MMNITISAFTIDEYDEVYALWEQNFFHSATKARRKNTKYFLIPACPG